MKITACDQRRTCGKRGFTLVELLVGAGISSILALALMSLMFYTSRSFAALTNYVDLDAYSKNALDRMTSEIRQTRRLALGNDSRLVFIDSDGKTLIYAYNAKTRMLTRTKDGVADKEPLLRQCDSLKFSMYQRNPIKGTYDQYPTATANTCKLIQVQWTCSRDLIYLKWNTESILSAKIVIRNNPSAPGAVPPGTI